MLQFEWVRNSGVAWMSCLAQLLPWGDIGWGCRNLMAGLGSKNLVLKLLTHVAASRRSILTQLVVGSNPLLAFDRSPWFLDTHPVQRDCFKVLMTWQLVSSEWVSQEREGQNAFCHTPSLHHILFVRNESLNPVQDQGSIFEGQSINNLQAYFKTTVSFLPTNILTVEIILHCGRQLLGWPPWFHLLVFTPLCNPLPWPWTEIALNQGNMGNVMEVQNYIRG